MHLDFCPLSPVTTSLSGIFFSSGTFLQQLKIVSKNVSQKKGQGFTEWAHQFCELRRELGILFAKFYYYFERRE